MRISRIPVGSGLGLVTRWLISPLLLAFIALLSFYSPVSRVNAAPDTAVFSFEGFHDIADCALIAGWAWDSTQPDTPIDVDIYVDNALFTTVAANEFRQDLFNAGKGNGEHGFSLVTPEALKDGQPHEIRVRIAASNIDLGNTPKTINCNPHAYEGFHDIADCNIIAGWAWDANQPNTPINVDVHIDGHPFVDIQAPANQFRQDLLNAGKGNGVHGFSFPTPNSLKNGMPHTIRITFSGTQIDLQFTSKTITCMGNTPPALEGFFDSADCSFLVGWAWDANQPNTPISVDIYADGFKFATVQANRFRQSLVDAGKGNGFHEFFIPTPNELKNGQPHEIRVRVVATTFDLDHTPKTITCMPPPGSPAIRPRPKVIRNP